MKKSVPLFSLLAILGLAASLRAASFPMLSLDLQTVEEDTLKNSHELQALSKEAEASIALEDSTRAQLFPVIAADAKYFNLSHVAEFQLSPQAPPVAFGTHDNWSAGISANWNLFNGGSTFDLLNAAKKMDQAKQEELINTREALRLKARLAYFQTQLAAERVRLLANSVVLAQGQASDLSLRLKAGTSSRIDALSSSNEELARRILLRAARADLASSLRDLYALSGVGEGSDPSVPGVTDLGNAIPEQVEAPTLLVKLDPLEESLQALSPAAGVQFDATKSSRLRQLIALRDAARAQADVAFTGHYPHFGVGARWSEDYPDAVLPQTANQTTLSANASLPLFSFGAVHNQVKQQDALADAAAERELDQSTDVERDLLKSKDRLAALASQKALNEAQVEQTATLADLEFKAYKIGGASYLEVQSASLQALEASTALVTTETQMLIELATLDASSR